MGRDVKAPNGEQTGVEVEKEEEKVMQVMRGEGVPCGGW